MTEINDKAKVQLLFKEFTGVVNAKQPEPFSLESFAFKDYILNNNVLLEDIPATLPSGWRSNQLDASANIPDNSIINLAAIGYPQLSFHKKRDLSSVTFGSFKTWYVDNGSGGSALQNAIPFKQDPGPNNSYNYSVYQKFTLPTSYSPVNMYSNPTFWLFDFKSGFLEFYGDEDDLNGTNTGGGGIDLVQGPPAISFFQYVGATGGAGGGGSGGQSVTIEPWPEPNPQPPNTFHEINYVIATVDISGNSEMALGYFTLQLGDPYKQVMGFYAGFIENKGAFIKIISCTNEDAFNKYGFKNLKIISYQGTCYLVSTFGRAAGGAGDPDLLKIILVNNNANLDNPTNNPNWILRALDSDWAPNGPEPPATRMPWTVGPSYPVPALPPALVTVSLLQNGGHPYGVSTQPEYFQNNIVLDTSANILAGENGTGIIDICGGLYVDRDASFNRDVHVRSSVGISGNLNVDGPGNFGRNLNVDGSGNFGGNLFAANTPMIEYIKYDNSNFDSGHVLGLSGSWQTIAQIYPISPLNTQVDTRAAYAIFEIVDRSNNDTVYNFQDNITCIISYTTGECTLNVLSSNPTGNTSGVSHKGYIGKIRLQCGKHSLGGGNLPSANLQIKRFCDESGAGTTDVRIRMYHNFQPMLLPKEFTPFVLTSTSLTLTNITKTEFDVLNYITGFKSSTTKRQYVDKSTIDSLFMGGDIDMGSNNIVNANIISWSTAVPAPRIEFDTSGINLLINENVANARIVMGDYNTPSQQIYMRVNPDVTLDMNNIEISNVSTITSPHTIDICANNIIIGAVSDITIDASNIDLSANTYNIDIRDGNMKIQQDISTNEIWIKNIGGSGYAKSREYDTGLGINGGWPSNSGSLSGNNTIIKVGRWVDMGGLAPVNMFTLPSGPPWNQMDSNSVIQDGRSLIGMNLRSTYKYFLKREAQGDLIMGTNKIFVPELDFYTKTPTVADSLFTSVGDVGFDPSGGLVQFNNSQLNMVNSDITRYSFSAVGFVTGTTPCGLSHGGTVATWDVNLASTYGTGGIGYMPPSLTQSGTSLIFDAGKVGFGSPSGWIEWKNSYVVEPGDVTLNNLTNITKKFYEMPQSNSKGHIVGGAFYGASGGGSTSACIQFDSSMNNATGYVTFRLAGSGSGFTPNTGCDFLTITKSDSFSGGRFSIKNNFRDSTYVELPNEVTIDVIVRVYQFINVNKQGKITLSNNVCHFDFMINHLLKL